MALHHIAQLAVAVGHHDGEQCTAVVGEVKIQTAVNGKGGVTGEISTEISEIYAL